MADPQEEIRARLRQREVQGGRGERRPVPRGALKSEKNDDAAKQFEEERRAWREKNAAAKLANNSDSVGTNDDEERQIQKGRDLQQKNRDSLAKSILMAKQSTDVGQETLMKLTAQREQMRKMDEELDKTNESLNRSERVIRGMKSTLGGLKNLFSKPKDHVSQRLDKNLKVSGENGETDGVKANGSRTTTRGGPEDDLPVDEEEERRRMPIKDRDLSNESIRTREAMQEFQQGMQQEDEQLGELGELLGQLKGQAEGMNTELKMSAQLVEHLGAQVDLTHARVKKADANVKQID